ncbi:MAG: GGDEF domain-containing protein [Rhodospirillaceae bacterium]|nr:GGDEF domain-containing protein [Rhodospirillaceae bacterium]
MRVPTQLAAAATAVFLVLLAFAAAGWPLLSLHDDTLRRFDDRAAMHFLDEAAEEIGEQVNFAHHYADSVAEYLSARSDAGATGDDLQWLLIALVTSNPWITSLEYADRDGRIQRVERNDAAAEGGFQSTIRMTSGSDDWAETAQLDDHANPLFWEIVDAGPDPREQPWYQGAVGRRNGLTSLEAADGDALTIAVALPTYTVDDAIGGVVRARLTDPDAMARLACRHPAPCPSTLLVEDGATVAWQMPGATAPGQDDGSVVAADIDPAVLADLVRRLPPAGSGPRRLGFVEIGDSQILGFGLRGIGGQSNWALLHLAPPIAPSVHVERPLVELGVVALLLVVVIAALVGNGLGKAIVDRMGRVMRPLTADPTPAQGRNTARRSGLVLTEFEALAADVDDYAAQIHDVSSCHSLIVRGMRDGVIDVRMNDGRVWASHHARVLLDRHSVRSVDDLISAAVPEDRAKLTATLDAACNDPDTSAECEIRLLRSDGSEAPWVHVRAVADLTTSGSPVRLVVLLADITDAKNTEARLTRDAFHDRLTGLPNRTLLIERLAADLDRVKKGQIGCSAVISIDLDGFRMVNDNLGQSAGDDLLIAVARRLMMTAGTGALVARTGGDQFTIHASNTPDQPAALHVAERLCEALEQPMILSGQEFFPTASFGVALCTAGYSRAEAILSDANIAMARAKDQGRGLIHTYDPRMRGDYVAGQLSLEADLHHALDRREFELFYQPIIDLSAERVAGFEALIRWRNPDRGLIPPYQFISLCEQLGLIVEMGAWAIHEATKQITRLSALDERHKDLFISVNVSRRQLDEPGLPEMVHTALERSGLPPSRLHLEVTESLLMEQRASVFELLSQIKALGVRLSIDDFGTGYSSLSRLHRFPFDILKIDRSFVADILTNRGSSVLVQSVVDLAHSLGLEVIAEGAETPADVEALKSAGCQLCQGYVFARPMPPPDCERFLAIDDWRHKQPSAPASPVHLRPV